MIIIINVDSNFNPWHTITFCLLPTSLGKSQIGPIVSKITEHPRCAQLKEGDLLMEVNEVDVHSYSHSALVMALKQYPKGNQATFVVLRHPNEVRG